LGYRGGSFTNDPYEDKALIEQGMGDAEESMSRDASSRSPQQRKSICAESLTAG
jgi:hypothetical protein